MLIYICCSGGATSSMFCQKIGEASGKHVLVEHILAIAKNIDKLLEEYDLVLAYGPVDILRDYNLKESNLEKKIKSVWVAPQVRYAIPSLKGYLDTLHIPVSVIDMHTFGIMDGEKAYQDIMASLA